MSDLNKKEILKHISEHWSDQIDLETFDIIDSTNSYLLEKESNDKIDICIADGQSAGRGRHGKSWVSPQGENIYLSFSHPLKMDFATLSGFSLMIGIILAKTLQLYCQSKILLKWPNDLLVEGKKLSGILVEIKNLEHGNYRVITGLGVNLRMPEKELATITQPSIDLNHCQPHSTLSRNQIIASIVSNVLEAVKDFNKNGFETYQLEWNKLDAWINKPVELLIADRATVGIHRGIDTSGALQLEIEGKISSWSAGEISLRRLSQ